MNNGPRVVAVLFAGLLALTACGSSEPADVKAMEQTYVDNSPIAIAGTDDIKGHACDGTYTDWSCFYSGVEDRNGDLQVSLSTDGGWSDDDLDTMAQQTANSWWIGIGCDYPDLDTIWVTTNGLDHWWKRSDMPPTAMVSPESCKS